MKTLETALLLFASSIRAQTKGLGRYMESSIRLLVLFGERANGRVEGWVDARTSNENWPQQAPNQLPTNSQPAATFHYRPQCARRSAEHRFSTILLQNSLQQRIGSGWDVRANNWVQWHNCSVHSRMRLPHIPPPLPLILSLPLGISPYH